MQNIAPTQGFGTDRNYTFRLFVFIFSDIQYLANHKRKQMQRQTLTRQFTLSSSYKDF